MVHVPDSHLAQKDIQVHKRGKKPERNLSRSSLHIYVMSNIIDAVYFCQSEKSILVNCIEQLPKKLACEQVHIGAGSHWHTNLAH